MRSAFVVRDSVDFVDDDGLDTGEVLAWLFSSEQDVERLWRCDEDVRRSLEHRGALFGERIAGANAGADLRAEVATCLRKELDLSKRSVEVLLDVVGEGFEGRDVDDVRARFKGSFERGAKQLIDADEESGEGFAGACRSGDQSWIAAEDGGPAFDLGFSRSSELRGEPFLHQRVRPRESGMDVERGRRGHKTF